MTYVPERLTARRRFIACGNSRTSRALACVFARAVSTDRRTATAGARSGGGSLEKPSRFIGGIGGLSSRMCLEIGEEPSTGRSTCAATVAGIDPSAIRRCVIASRWSDALAIDAAGRRGMRCQERTDRSELQPAADDAACVRGRSHFTRLRETQSLLGDAFN